MKKEQPILEGIDASLLDIVDHVLNQGIVVTGDLVLGVADVDLVYLRASVVLCAADRILGPRAKRRRGEPPRDRALPPRALLSKPVVRKPKR